MNIVTQTIGFTATEKLESFIDKKVNKLERLGAPIIKVDIILKAESKGQVNHKVAELVMTLPGKQLHTRQKGMSYEASIERSVDTMRQQLSRLKGRYRDARRSGS